MPDGAEAGHWGQVILLNDTVVALHRDGTVSRLMHLITLLHGEQQLADWDDVTRDYDRRVALETVRTAGIHLPDGSWSKAAKTVLSLDPRQRVVNVAFHPLRPGVVLEFEAQFDRFRPFEMATGLWTQMFIQGPAPQRRFRFTVAVAEPFRAEFALHHCDLPPDESLEKGYHVFRWDLCDLPGIEMDPWVPPLRDCAPWIDLTTLSDWRSIADYYHRELDPGETAPVEVRRLARELTCDVASDRDKLLKVYRYAARDVRYGRHPKDVEIETPRQSARMLEDLRGDCKDKSALMVSLLRELGLPAEIALVQTRANGETPSLPAPWFDHALVRSELDGSALWIDAAAGPYTFGRIPGNDCGVEALLLDGLYTRVDIPETTVDQQQVVRVCRGELDDNGTYRFDAEVTVRGDEAAGLRSLLLDRIDEHRIRMLGQMIAADLTGADVSDIRIDALDDLSRDVQYRYVMAIRRWGRCVRDLWLLRIPWSHGIETTGPVSAGSRVQPLAAPGVLAVDDRHEIDIPPGFAGYGLPYTVTADSPWGRYSCSIVSEASRLICHRRIEHQGGIVPPEKFLEFKQFWETCARSDAADVVLMKQTG